MATSVALSQDASVWPCEHVLMRDGLRTLVGLLVLGLSWLGPARSEAAFQINQPSDIALAFAHEVAPRLELPVLQQASYAERLEEALVDAGVVPATSQYIVVVDRNPNVQAAMIYWRPAAGTSIFIGAAPAATGSHGGFEHFETPLGVFDHSLANPDFRAEGTKNELGVRGYGIKGMRVYDFGWVDALRTWDEPSESPMRLQMHSTDPALLEPLLGMARSKGCIRIPATLNAFIDHYGILDADYERALAAGRKLWVLDRDRTPTPWSGRYLVVVDSRVATRPTWAPLPRRR